MFLSKTEAGPLSVFYPSRHTDFLQCFTWRRDTDHPCCGRTLQLLCRGEKKTKSQQAQCKTTATFVPRRLRNTNDHCRKERGARLEANLSTRVSPQGNAPLGCRGPAGPARRVLPPHGRRRGTPPPASPPAARSPGRDSSDCGLEAGGLAPRPPEEDGSRGAARAPRGRSTVIRSRV